MFATTVFDCILQQYWIPIERSLVLKTLVKSLPNTLLYLLTMFKTLKINYAKAIQFLI